MARPIIKMNRLARKQEIQRKIDSIKMEVLSSSSYSLLSINLDDYTSFYGLKSTASYGDLDTKILAREKYINEVSDRLAGLFNQYLLLTLLRDFDIQGSDFSLSSVIKKKYQHELDRIESQLDEFGHNFYQLSNDKFLKDLAILSHRLIPMGAEFVVPYSGVPRTLILKQGFIQFCKGFWACIVCSGGFYPYLELHAHTLSMGEFNPEGWLQTYINLAEFLEENPAFRGVVSSSWFLDPALDQISPHLLYLRKIPEENGATILFNCWDYDGKSGALDKSESRRRLFESEDYRPAVYTRIWPRKKLLSFKNKKLGIV